MQLAATQKLLLSAQTRVKKLKTEKTNLAFGKKQAERRTKAVKRAFNRKIGRAVQNSYEKVSEVKRVREQLRAERYALHALQKKTSFAAQLERRIARPRHYRECVAC